MASASLIAARIAHEINNPVAVLDATIELIAGSIDASPELEARPDEPLRVAG